MANSRRYPWIGKYYIEATEGFFLVRFTSRCAGKVIHREFPSTQTPRIGYESTDWLEEEFTPCTWYNPDRSRTLGDLCKPAPAPT